MIRIYPFADALYLNHKQGNLFTNFSKIGSYVGIIISLWKVFDVFLLKKYRNKQARNIMDYHGEAQPNLRELRGTKEKLPCLLSYSYLRQYCCLKKS